MSQVIEVPVTSDENRPHTLPTLHHIGSDFSQFMQVLLDNGGDLTDELEQEWAELLATLDKKAGNVHAALLQLRAEAQYWKDEENRFKALRTKTEKSFDSLKRRLENVMELAGDREIKTDKGTLKLVASGSGSVKVTVPVDDLPDVFVRVKKEADLTEIRAWLTSEDEGVREKGAAVAYIEPAKATLRI